MAGPHDRIISDAAKTALSPLGFKRKGRSRIWLADHGWWITAVEFQPSSWSRGTYLNVGAHWLWSGNGYLSFDFGHRVEEFVEYLSEVQFALALVHLGQRATQEAERLDRLFHGVSAVADVLITEVRHTHEPGQGSWVSYNAGVAAGLTGRPGDATEMFNRILGGSPTKHDALTEAAQKMVPLVGDPPRLRAAVAKMIEVQRAALRLPTLSKPPI